MFDIENFKAHVSKALDGFEAIGAQSMNQKEDVVLVAAQKDGNAFGLTNTRFLALVALESAGYGNGYPTAEMAANLKDLAERDISEYEGGKLNAMALFEELMAQCDAATAESTQFKFYTYVDYPKATLGLTRVDTSTGGMTHASLPILGWLEQYHKRPFSVVDILNRPGGRFGEECLDVIEYAYQRVSAWAHVDV